MLNIVTAPKVYLIGKQLLNEAELSRYMDELGVTWESDSEIAAEAISEVAGRTCYVSFAKPRPGGNAAYLQHIKEVGHGSVLEHAVWNFIFTGVSRSLTHELVRHKAGTGFCLAGDTEVFSGSKCNGRFDGVKKRWKLKQLYAWSRDPKRKGRLKLLMVRCFDGTKFVQAGIRAVAASGVKQLFKVALADGKTVRCSAEHRFMTPDGWKPVRDLCVGEPLATNGLPPVNLSRDDLAKQYGPERRTIAEIAASYHCSPHTVRKWLKRFGLQKRVGSGMTGRIPPNKGTRYTTGYKHRDDTRALLAELKRGPKNPQWLGDAASENAGRARARKLFPDRPCEACGAEEGHRHHLDRDTRNNAESNIEFLCAACHTRRHIAEDGPANVLTVRWVAVASIVPDGQEETYDIEVDHPAHNFVANGFVTHNSQLSQRYVDESVAEYVEPDIIANDPELHALFTDAVSHAHASYVKLAEKLGEKLAGTGSADAVQDRTAVRKAARQAARSVLPNATETKIFFTANARALRNVIEQRCSRHAEPEIRKLFGKVWEVLVAEAPNLFGDYEKVPLPDGTFELTTPYRKV